MKFSLSLVGAAALALSALPAQAQDANTPTIQTPPAIVQCQPVQVGFAGGQAPYFISILPGVRTRKKREALLCERKRCADTMSPRATSPPQQSRPSQSRTLQEPTPGTPTSQLEHQSPSRSETLEVYSTTRVSVAFDH